MNPKERSSVWKNSLVKKKPMQRQTVQENNQRSEIARRRVRLTVQEGRLAPRNKEENRARKEQNAKARKEREAMKAGRRSGKKI